MENCTLEQGRKSQSDSENSVTSYIHLGDVGNTLSDCSTSDEHETKKKPLKRKHLQVCNHFTILIFNY